MFVLVHLGNIITHSTEYFYECNKGGKALSLFQFFSNMKILIQEKDSVTVNTVKKDAIISHLLRCETSLNVGEQHECNYNDKILKYNSSLKVNQIVKLIHTNEKIHNVLNVVILCHLPVSLQE